MRYPVVLEKDSNGTILVSFPDIPEAHTFGDDEDEALTRAVDAIDTAHSMYVDDRQDIPAPSRRRGAKYVTLPALTEGAPDSIATANIGWTEGCWQALQPFAAGGVYVNYRGEEGADRVKAAYSGNYDRLVAVKTQYDPTNRFRGNQYIRPSA